MTKLDWFGGDHDALDLYLRLVAVAHTWDDLIDKDKDVSEANINTLIANLLLYLPSNPFYRRYEEAIRAHFYSAFVGYQAANIMEKSSDGHKVELAHYLRYAVLHVVSFMLAAIHGIDKAAVLLADAAVVMVPERLTDYVKEHTK